MRDISYILEQYTQTQLSSYFLERLNAKTALAVLQPHSSPSAAVVCIAARLVHSIAFALTVSAPASSPIIFSSASHFLKKVLRVSTLENEQSLYDLM